MSNRLLTLAEAARSMAESLNAGIAEARREGAADEQIERALNELARQYGGFPPEPKEAA